MENAHALRALLPTHEAGATSGQNGKGQGDVDVGTRAGLADSKCPQRGVPLRPLADVNPEAPQASTNHCLFRCITNLHKVPHLKSNLTNLEEKCVF